MYTQETERLVLFDIISLVPQLSDTTVFGRVNLEAFLRACFEGGVFSIFRAFLVYLTGSFANRPSSFTPIPIFLSFQLIVPPTGPIHLPPPSGGANAEY